VIARIADLDSFRVEATVSDVHAARLTPGLPVRVLLDGETLEGHLASVHPRIENGVVRFDVALVEPAHPKLRNNLRVDVLIVTGSRRDVVRLPQGSFAGGGALAQVFVVEGSRAVRTEVRFGLAGHQHVEIEEGLLPGQEVILSDMSQYLHLEEVQVDD
jgi:HlyD family secretion protein